MSLAARGPGNTAVRSGPVSAAAVVCGFNIADACGRLGAGAGEALIGADECRFYRVLAGRLAICSCICKPETRPASVAVPACAGGVRTSFILAGAF